MLGCCIDALTWPEAERALREYPVVVLPIGARTKEHGLHLQLNNDWLMAEYLTRRVAERSRVLILPTLQYGFYPAFLEYPGSRPERCARPGRLRPPVLMCWSKPRLGAH